MLHNVFKGRDFDKLENINFEKYLSTEKAARTENFKNTNEFKKEFDELLQKNNLKHYWTYPKSPKMNAYNERFNITIQEQFVDYYEDLLFTDIQLFNEKMADWLVDYNTKIPHHSLLMKTPVEYLIDNNHLCHMYWTDTFYLQNEIKMIK